jgi:phosphatidylglycerophosphate synthase
MDPLQFLVPLGWIETIGPIVPIGILVLVVANIGTRILENRMQAHQVKNDEPLTRHPLNTFTTMGIVTLGLLFTVYRPISGMIMMIAIFGLFVADVFEFEGRQIEADNGLEFEWPKATLGATGLTLIYAMYYALTPLYSPILDMIFA